METAAPVRPWVDRVSRVVGPRDSNRPQGRLLALLEDGTKVICARHRIPDGVAGPTLLARLHDLANVHHPNLLPILGGGIRGESLWIFSEEDAGISLEQLLSRHAPTPAQAVAITLSVLAGLQALQSEGFGHGAIVAGNVQVAGFGQVRLTDHGFLARPNAKGDVAATGRLLCTLLGIDPEKRAGDGSGPKERAFPGLAATALTIASGNAGRSATTALNMLSDAAGRRGTRGRIYLSIAELERLVRSDRPAIRAAVDSVLKKPVLPAAAAPSPRPAPIRVLAPARLPTPPPRPRPIERPPAARRGRWQGPLLAVGAAVVLVAAALMAGSHRPAPARSVSRVSAEISRAATAAGAPVTAPAPAAVPSPDTVVNDFYRLVLARRFDAAVATWDDHLKAAYPPEQNVNQRFSGTTTLNVNSASISSQDSATAVVTTDLTEVTDGVQYHWVGTWTLVRGADGWLLDQPNFQPA